MKKCLHRFIALADTVLSNNMTLSYYNCSAEYMRTGWCGGNKYLYKLHTISHYGFIGDGGRGFDATPYSDVQDNYFDNPTQIMTDAYTLWKRANG